MLQYVTALMPHRLMHLKLMYDDCRYVHYRRKENKAAANSQSRNVVMNTVDG
jgi:hypothetical protein